MKKKFKIRKDLKRLFRGRYVYRIEALVGRGDFHPGELGGWVQKEENLSHEGNSWIHPSAVVYDRARVLGHSVVLNSKIGGTVTLKDVGIWDADLRGSVYIHGSSYLNKSPNNLVMP